MSDQAVINTIRTKSDQALLAAWRRFLDYDQASTAQKLHNNKIRTAIIILGFSASALAVAISTKDENPIIASIAEPLRIILIFLPIITASLLSYASVFAPSLTWLAYRIGAELTRREIYLYRMQAGDYTGKPLLDQQELLLTQIESANKRVTRMGVPDPYLQTTMTDIPAAVKSKTANSADDGFSQLTPDEYVEYRVIPQKDWYIRKSHQDYLKTRRWRIYLLIVAGTSSVLAALGAAPFVAVTTALGTALATYMELKMFGRNYPVYHPVANSLEIEMDRWNILTADQQKEPAHISAMVKHLEDLFQSEGDQWTQQAIQAQQAIEQSLAKSGSSQQGQSSTTTNLVVSQPDSSTTVVAMHTQTTSDSSSSPDASAGVTVVAGSSAPADGSSASQSSPVTITAPLSSDPSTPVVATVTLQAGTPTDTSVSAAPAAASTSTSSTDSSASTAASPASTPVVVTVATNGSSNGSSNGSANGSSNGAANGSTSGSSSSTDATADTSTPHHPADHGDGTAG